jgi:hypothetical protein
MNSAARRPVFVQPHSGKVLEFLSVTHKLTSQQTGGAFYLVEAGALDNAMFRKLSLDYGIE